jgi:hypothetical protein
MHHARPSASLDQEEQLTAFVKEEKRDTVYTEFLVNVINYGNKETRTNLNSLIFILKYYER